MKTVALFGGSFDPPHIGHEAVVKALTKLDFIDKVIVMPTYLNPFKSKSYAPSELRLKWLQKIFYGEEKVTVSDYEVTLATKVPTIDTLNHLLTKYDKVFVVIGADNLQTLKMWKSYDIICSSAQFIIASRDTIEIPKEYMSLIIDKDISSSYLREHIDQKKLPNSCAKEIAQFYKENNER